MRSASIWIGTVILGLLSWITLCMLPIIIFAVLIVNLDRHRSNFAVVALVAAPYLFLATIWFFLWLFVRVTKPSQEC